MKKNVMLKIASVLMIAVLLTTCAISSTFAKYVTDGGEVKTNTARVAKWNLSITGQSADEIGLFLDSYDNVKGMQVDGQTPAIVVAPGTNNAVDAFSIKLEGKPEVAYKLIVTADLALTGWDADGYYCPLAIVIDGGDPIYGNTYTSITEFKAAVEKAIAAAVLGQEVDKEDGEYSLTYNAYTEVPEATRDGVAVSWFWAFDDKASNNTGNPAKSDDKKDTILGNAGDSTISIKFSVRAEQVD